MRKKPNYWTYENCKNVALKCDTKTEFNVEYYGAYKRSIVFQHIKKYNSSPIKKILSDYVKIKKAQELELYWVNEYKKNGWNILNKNKTGGLGGNIIFWTKDKCHEVALKYCRRVDFAKNETSAYISARKNKWLDDICNHMQEKKKRNYWNYDTCKNASKLCTTRFEFSRKFSRVYTVSLENNWLDKFYLNI
jgi:hypothetical protein